MVKVGTILPILLSFDFFVKWDQEHSPVLKLEAHAKTI